MIKIIYIEFFFCNYLKNNTKISLIVFGQIALIITSFLSIVMLDSQITLAGNSVNVAGKNRLLASLFLNEFQDSVYKKNLDSGYEDRLLELEENLFLLKNGGYDNHIRIPKLDDSNISDWNDVYSKFLSLKSNQLEIHEVLLQTNYSTLEMSMIEKDTSNLISTSNILVEKIGANIEETSQKIILVEIVLLILNVIVHLGLLLLIFRILKKNFEYQQKIEKLATVGELASRLAHDMRNPLSNINLATQLLKSKISEKETISNSEMIEKLTVVEKGISRMSHQINDVMDFVKLKTPELKPCDLNLILDDCIKRLNIPKSVKIILPEHPVTFQCDLVQFEVLLINLISNALDSIQNVGSIQITSVKTSKKVIIKVIDSGEGILENQLDVIFEPLISFKEKGTGLGLASCKNIVENHKGTISVKNNPTTFTIEIPR